MDHPLLAGLVHSDWDKAFIANPAFKDWLIAQLAARPIPANQLLVEYVRERLGSGAGAMAAQPTQPAPQAEQPMYVNPASMTYSSSSAPSNAVASAPAQQAYIDPSVMTLKSTNSARAATRSVSPATTSAPKASTSAVSSSAWNRIQPEVKQLLDPNLLTKAPRGTTSKLIDLLSPFGSLEDPATAVPSASRLLVLEAFLRRGSPEVWSAWAEHKNGAGMAVLDQWVKDVVAAIAPRANTNAKGKEKEVRIHPEPSLLATLVPLLKILAKLPLTIERIRPTDLGRLLTRITMYSHKFSPDAVDLATKTSAAWRKMIEDKKKVDDKRAADLKLQEERKAAKPKVEDSKKRTGTPTAADARKKPKLEPTISKKPDVKPDMSAVLKKGPNLLSMSKIGRNKVEPPARGGLGAIGGAGSSAMAGGAFAEAMKIFEKPTVPAYENGINKTSALSMSAGPPGQKSYKKRKNLRVRWVADDDLVAIRWIDRAPNVEGIDDVAGDDHQADLAAMNHDEGATLHSASIGEEMEWMEPEDLFEVLTEDDLSQRVYPRWDFLTEAEPKTEVQIQAEREAKVDPVTYEDDSALPPSPDEPLYVPHEEIEPLRMELGPNAMNDPEFKIALEHVHRPETRMSLAEDPQIQQLLAQLLPSSSTSMAPAYAPPPAPSQNINDLLASVSNIGQLNLPTSSSSLQATLSSYATRDPSTEPGFTDMRKGWGKREHSSEHRDGRAFHM